MAIYRAEVVGALLRPRLPEAGAARSCRRRPR